MPHADFDLLALYRALDDQRRERAMRWAAVAREINRFNTTLRPVAASTIAGLRTKPRGEGDGILQMLIWLGRTPESFVPGIEDVDAAVCRLPAVGPGQILRWNTQALYLALDAQRQQRGLTWREVAQQVGGCTAGMLTHLAKGGRVGLPGVMRIVRWLGRPAATFTRIARW